MCNSGEPHLAFGAPRAPGTAGVDGGHGDRHDRHERQPADDDVRHRHAPRLQRVDEVREVLVPGEQIEIAPDRLLDVVLEHGDDQLILAFEIRIERAAGKTGGGRNRLDAGAADALFLEHPRRCLEQFFAGVVPGGSGSNS